MHKQNNKGNNMVDSKPSIDEITNKLDELQVRGVHHTEELSLGRNILNLGLTLLLTTYLGWSLGLLIDFMAFYLISFHVAPTLANSILKQRVKSFVMNNYNEMADKGKGTVDFYLHNQRYNVVWEHVDVTDENNN